jgi:hypothetical protein
MEARPLGVMTVLKYFELSSGEKDLISHIVRSDPVGKHPDPVCLPFLRHNKNPGLSGNPIKKRVIVKHPPTKI